ncbi:MAG: carboxymuconolactone decarboxylase family protein [SAR324 cluster bacterium]|nr:carboxymuconolactone decarboxylase family protein [SAR324 cluster bacterium]
MNGFINPPPRIPILLRLGIWVAEKSTGKRMLPARLLAWVPKSALGSGILEALVVHKDKTVSQRLLKLVRMQTSFFVSCPFCIDMNSSGYTEHGISEEEILALRELTPLDNVNSLHEKEKTALEYVRLISQTPILFSETFINKLKSVFAEREIVVLATTVAQVNYWARLIQALGIPPAGFSENCEILEIDSYRTLK